MELLFLLAAWVVYPLGLAFLPTDEGFVSFQGLAPATQRTEVNKPCRGVMDRVLHFATA